MKTEGILSAIETTMGGLSNQMRRLRIISENIANADRIAGKDGKVYKRKILVPRDEKHRAKNLFANQLNLKMKQTRQGHFNTTGRRLSAMGDEMESNYKVAEQKTYLREYDPNNPMADENGYVTKPDINVVEEMVDMITATRMYEANVSVMDAAKKIAKKSLEI